MGIVYDFAAMLAMAKQAGTRFDRILTIGHLTLYLSRKQIERLAGQCGLDIDTSGFSGRQYADDFFRTFYGANEVMSLDYSDYENCDIIHDLNYPVDAVHHDQFDAVIDGGSLEHVFNFPTTIANCMQMVKKGGSLFVYTMADNHTGHGFYQFSPELFYRVLQPDNGFEVKEMILERHPFPGAELGRKTSCYSVVDPAAVKERVGLVARSPVALMVHAVKIDSKPVFTSYPIQSSYTLMYESVSGEGGVQESRPRRDSLPKAVARKALGLLPTRVKDYLLGKHQLSLFSFSNRRFYKRWYPFRER